MATEQQEPRTARDQARGEYSDHDPYGHGHSTAAWAAVGIALVGFFVMSVAVVLTSLWLFIVGAVITVAGGITGKVLGAMGLGAKQPSVH